MTNFHRIDNLTDLRNAFKGDGDLKLNGGCHLLIDPFTQKVVLVGQPENVLPFEMTVEDTLRQALELLGIEQKFVDPNTTDDR